MNVDTFGCNAGSIEGGTFVAPGKVGFKAEVLIGIEGTEDGCCMLLTKGEVCILNACGCVPANVVKEGTADVFEAVVNPELILPP